MEDRLKELLENNGYSDVEFDFNDGNMYWFDAYSDAPVRVSVDVDVVEGNKARVYDQYMGDKHFSFQGEYILEGVIL
ncbi:MAG TPA: hypothetical protein VFH42_00260 [Sporolactobacillaceae bacterium]|nr:hypothetical protein [Sporolactobacillaceae bacterium]